MTTEICSKSSPRPIQAPVGGEGRKLFCTYYSECVDHAVKRKWTGFNCSSCRAYRHELRHWDEDLSRCRVLLAHVWADLTNPVHRSALTSYQVASKEESQ